jgi:hypothetical protein
MPMKGNLMSLDPALTATVARTEPAPDAVDWNAYRKCSQVCRAEIGQPCFSLSGRIVGGRPDGVRTPLTHAHAARKLRIRRK